MEPVKRAVIDVGTNSIKLLIADVLGKQVIPLIEESKQTRLGRGFYESHRLQAEAIRSTAHWVAEFADMARSQGAASIRVIATSAARDAVNQEELISTIENASGLRVEIITGEQEADWAFQGVTSDPALASEPLLLLDVGGGSTEFILGQKHEKFFRESFPLGTVRLLERFPHSDPPQPQELAACRQWLAEFLAKEVAPRLEPALRSRAALADGKHVQLIGTGGTTSILARMEARLQDYDRASIEAVVLTGERIHWHVEHLWSLLLAERKRIIGLPKNRADVILTGAVVYEAIMERFGFTELHVSTRGLRFAAVLANPETQA